MNYNSKPIDNTNSGILFANNDNWQIIQQGKLNLKGDEQRIIGVKRKNKNGEQIVELYRAIGTLKKSDNDMDINQDPSNDRRPPDAKGVVNMLVSNTTFSISAWKNISPQGNVSTGLKVTEFDQQYESKPIDQSEPEEEEINPGLVDDEIPF